MLDFARLYDYIPIHTDEEYAKQTVFGALIAPGVMPFMTTGAINEMTCAGSLLIIMIGMNLMGITKLKVADYLPAIIFAPIIYNIVLLF